MTDRAPRFQMRVATINTWKGDGPYRARLRALIEQAAELDLDILALQEALVACDGSSHTPLVMADALGMKAAASFSRKKMRVVHDRSVLSWSGPAVLSRWPIMERHEVDLPFDRTDGPRVGLICEIRSPVGRILGGSLHRTHLVHLPALAQAQLQAFCRSPHWHVPAVARVVAGDFNRTPDSDLVRSLHRGWTALNRSWTAVDAFVAGQGGTERATMSPRNTNLRTGAEPKCIDYIFGIAPDPEPIPEFSDARIVFDRPSAEGVYPSDHFGVAVTAALPGEAEVAAVDGVSDSAAQGQSEQAGST